MLNRCSLKLYSVFVLLFLASTALYADWEEDGNPVCTAIFKQDYADMVPDGFGGTIMVWSDGRESSGYLHYDLYAQRFDLRGNALWDYNGKPVASDTLDQYDPSIVPDGEGNFIIGWCDWRFGNADVYAQKINLNGDTLWTRTLLCSASGNQVSPEAVPVEGGGAIIAWLDNRNSPAYGYNIYAQRIDNDGNILWAADGVAACDDPAGQEEMVVTTDGNKGIILAWKDHRMTFPTDIYCQRIDSTGTILWGSGGSGLCQEIGNQSNPAIVWDGLYGAVVFWSDTRDDNYDIYGSRVYSGSPAWGSNGKPVCTDAGNQHKPVVTKYGDYQVVVAWQDQRGDDIDIYAQRYGLNGEEFWESNGKLIGDYASDRILNDMAEDGTGNVFLCWMDNRNVYNDIYAQKINEDGIPVWDPSGIEICSSYYYQTDAIMVTDEIGGAILMWEDQRNSSYEDLYALRLDASGNWGYPSPVITGISDVPNDQGGALSIKFDAGELDRFPYEIITHYTLWRSLTGEETSAVLARSGNTLPEKGKLNIEGTNYRLKYYNSILYGWECIESMDAHRLDHYSFTAGTAADSVGEHTCWEYYFVSSNTADPFTYWDSQPDSGYSVDNLCPCPLQGLAGKQSSQQEALVLSWLPNHDSDLCSYSVYRGETEDFIPGPGTLITSTSDTTWVDNEWSYSNSYYYRVAARDIHGNEGDTALLGPGDVTGDEMPAVPEKNYLAQNSPNPFNPYTEIKFGLRENVRVVLRIYDVSGRMVAELANEIRNAGNYTVEWNGKGRHNSGLSSGVYFYRLEAGEFRATRKMVLLR